ncbi:MAG: helix-turn-helix transcriptional regulator [Clostridia bacterium]|nr:helix-turn-helix transcriptional regulator [Clostridia bacterium]
MLRLKELRLSRNLSQVKVAEVLGCNQTAVGKYERGQLEPSLETLVKLANFFNCSIDYLLGLEDDFGNVNVVSAGETVELSEDERELLSCFEVLGPFEREAILIQIKALAGNLKDAPRSMRRIKQ